MYDSIIFDMDGTLWDSTPEVAVAFNKVLKEKYPRVKEEVTADKLRNLFGRPLDEIGIKLYQSVPAEQAVRIIRDCCDYETEYLLDHQPRLYEGIEKALKVLHANYKLLIVSNCQEGYIQCFFQVYPELKKYFTDFEYPGRTGKLKADNIGLVIERNRLKNPVYVGDTLGDQQAAKEAGVPFIFARYGFGDVKEYDHVIDSPLELIEKLTR